MQEGLSSNIISIGGAVGLMSGWGFLEGLSSRIKGFCGGEGLAFCGGEVWAFCRTTTEKLLFDISDFGRGGIYSVFFMVLVFSVGYCFDSGISVSRFWLNFDL